MKQKKVFSKANVQQFIRWKGNQTSKRRRIDKKCCLYPIRGFRHAS